MKKNRNRGRGGKSSKIEEADRLFSTLIRMKGLMHGDRVECYTCGATYHFRAMQCGHYIGRANMITRWLEENARPQCVECNEHKHGNIDEFTKRLEEEQPGLPDRLRALGREIAHHTASELDRLIIHLKQRIEACGGKDVLPSRY